MFRKRIQLALVHVAVAMALVPINSTLNRVMINELAISATLVAILASLPYLFSPLQVVIGSYSDRHPLFGFRRTPYIAAGLVLCVLGVVVAPHVVYLLPENRLLGLLLSVLAFGAWGMGFNLASVSYLSLASEVSGEKGRSRTVSIMWFVMIIGIILTASTLSHLLEDYTPARLQYAFEVVGLVALGLGALGLVGLEERHREAQPASPAPIRQDWQVLLKGVLGNPAARHFFFYLIILLAAILGQDVLLEPYAGETFGLPVSTTTRITTIWGGCVLITLLVAGWLERRMDKRTVARVGALMGAGGFILIAAAGPVRLSNVFFGGVVMLGLGTGLSTVSNLSLMLDMTTARVGLYIGAWGLADALARLLGTVMSGVVRDVVAHLSSSLWGYITVFSIQALLLLISLWMLSRIDVQHFRRQEQMSLSERAAMMNEVS
jgi:BCD family chlorophyll transporter-like MFS transporter